MKVEGTKFSQIQKMIAETVGRAQYYSAQNATKKGELDQTSFSEMAQLLSKTVSKFQDTGEVREDKVAQLKKDIVEGNYEINFADLARRLSLIIKEE